MKPSRIEQVLETLMKTRWPVFVWGPPGVGKTTLARLLAGEVEGSFAAMSAVTAGVAEVRKTIEKAASDRKYYSRATVLFIDEIHNVVGAGAVSGGSMDASNILKPDCFFFFQQFVQYPFHSVFKIAPEFCARQQSAHIQHEYLGIF
mgnify:CR=1 FL=1